MEWLSLPGEVQTFGDMMQSQLDLRIEAENLRIFRNNFESDPRVRFPQPMESAVTRELLVEELVKGVPLEKVIKYNTNSDIEKHIAATGLDAFLRMLLLHNFIHSDLHAGNIIVGFGKYTDDLLKAQNQKEWAEIMRKMELDGFDSGHSNGFGDYFGLGAANDAENLRIFFIDAGLVTELSAPNERNFIDLFKAIAAFDGHRVGELMVERSRTPETVIDKDVFELKCEALVNRVKRRTFTLGSVGIGDLLANVMEMVRWHHVRMESDFVTVILSILLLEGVGRSLDANLDIFKSALPVLRELATKRHADAIALASEQWNALDVLHMIGAYLFLETRQLLESSEKEVEECVKYDRLSPNV